MRGDEPAPLAAVAASWCAMIVALCLLALAVALGRCAPAPSESVEVPVSRPINPGVR
ncbi:MAG TPA: hypothetical protein PLN33_03915 [Hyphomonadaceae bacterium]|nr:hypothetical protein [Hyphomonadaceae bacterium]